VFIGDIIDVMKFDVNPYYEPINKTHAVYILLHESNNIDTQLDKVENQIYLEVNGLTKLIDVDVSIAKRGFQVTSIDNLDLLASHKKYNSSEYSHIYKLLPSISLTGFNFRMTVMKQNILSEKSISSTAAEEFIITLSKIEEQLLEFQFRGSFQSTYIIKFINELVGDGKTEFGVLTSMINLLDDRRYRYMVNDYLSRSSKYLSSEIKKIPELTYPTVKSLPNKFSSTYITDNKTLIFKIQ
jgi:hypothetical protein